MWSLRQAYPFAVLGVTGFFLGRGTEVMWPDLSAWTWWGLAVATPIIGFGGPPLVGWVFRRMNLVRGFPDFDKAISLLNDESHLVRETAARDLAELAKLRPSRFHVRTMRAFTSFLAYPPYYGSRHERAGQIDPYSPDTVAIMEAIIARTEEQRKAEGDAGYEFSLNPNSPFEYRDGSFWFRGGRLTQEASQ